MFTKNFEYSGTGITYVEVTEVPADNEVKAVEVATNCLKKYGGTKADTVSVSLTAIGTYSVTFSSSDV